MKKYTRYEKARMIGARALQIAHGAIPLIKIDTIMDPIEIAKKEFEEGVIPLDVKRPENY